MKPLCSVYSEKSHIRTFTNCVKHSFTICNTLQRGYLNTPQLLRNNLTSYNFIYLSTKKETQVLPLFRYLLMICVFNNCPLIALYPNCWCCYDNHTVFSEILKSSNYLLWITRLWHRFLSIIKC